MRFLFSLLTIGLLVPGFVMAKEGKTINVAAPSIRICGQTVSWRLIFNTITNKEAECLDSMSPLEVSALGIS